MASGIIADIPKEVRNIAIHCPYGVHGDRLWVRETFQPVQLATEVTQWRYAATDKRGLAPWKPSIFMPRKASRITLENTRIRVERLQDISHRDALAEGVSYDVSKPEMHPIAMYRKLWESINGKGSWAKNPWVWVIEFRKL